MGGGESFFHFAPWVTTFSPKAQLVSPEALVFAEGAGSKSPYLAIDVSSGANSFEIEKLRLSASQNGAFC